LLANTGLANTGLANTGPVPRRGEELHRVGGFAVGERVFHQKFGYGTIIAVEDNKLAIRFDVAGDKKIMDAFVEHA
jgi:DNA helicase-2/ATP-dependent DNA helicase PcrA